MVWFRRDLRLDDHHGLAEASWAGPVLAAFVIDPTLVAISPGRAAALHSAVSDLAAAIASRGGKLVIRRGDPRVEIPALAAEADIGSVFVTRDFSPYGRRRDRVVGDALKAGGRNFIEVDSNYSVRPGATTKRDGSSYAVFTPFHRAWSQLTPTETIGVVDSVRWLSAPSDGLIRSDRSNTQLTQREAWATWASFRDGKNPPIVSYEDGRDRLDLDATSHLSAHLRFGLIHPRQLMVELDPSRPAHAAFERQLAWRDFYADVLYHRPDSAWGNLNPVYDRMKVDTGPSAVAKFERWCDGTTGFPLVDAGMRQLKATGWMHNRARMVAASFLVKDLHLSWVWGAKYFLRHLIDGDLASNNHGWQWAAGSGTDAAPYFRIFNPTAQQERFDPTGAYVERWIPELGTSAYPGPMVDHSTERVEALDRYAEMRGSIDTDSVSTASLS